MRKTRLKTGEVAMRGLRRIPMAQTVEGIRMQATDLRRQGRCRPIPPGDIPQGNIPPDKTHPGSIPQGGIPPGSILPDNILPRQDRQGARIILRPTPHVHTATVMRRLTGGLLKARRTDLPRRQIPARDSRRIIMRKGNQQGARRAVYNTEGCCFWRVCSCSSYLAL